jgi:hypothetical protein
MGVVIDNQASIAVPSELSYSERGKLCELAMCCRNKRRLIGSVERCAEILGCSTKTCKQYLNLLVGFGVIKIDGANVIMLQNEIL